MMIDKTHSDYKKYEKEFWDLVEKSEKEIKEYKEQNPPNNARRDGGTSFIHKKYAIQIKEPI